MESTQEFANQNNQNSIDAKPIHVLIADDDPPTRLLLKAGILRWGYQVREASDGEEAWTIIQEKDPPEILILDWLMPKLDGIALCQRIQEQNSYKPYIILLTQISGTQNIIKGLEAGADEYLSKPFNMAELHSRLSVGAKLINNKKQLQHYVLKVDQLIKHISDITSQINNILQKTNSSSKKEHSEKDNKLHLDSIVALNTELQESLNVLRDFNLFVSSNIKGPLK